MAYAQWQNQGHNGMGNGPYNRQNGASSRASFHSNASASSAASVFSQELSICPSNDGVTIDVHNPETGQAMRVHLKHGAAGGLPLSSTPVNGYSSNAGPSRPASRASTTANGGGRARETLGRPDREGIERRRSASVASNSAMEWQESQSSTSHQQNGRDANGEPLLRRMGPALDQYQYDPDIRSQANSSRNSFRGPHPSSSSSYFNGNGNQGWGNQNDSFARPGSRMSQRSYGQGSSQNGYRGNSSNRSHPYGGPRQQFRPISAMSNREERAELQKLRTGFYPTYSQDNVINGELPRLPEDRIRPWFTAEPEVQIGVLISNLASGTTVQDIEVFAREGPPDTVTGQNRELQKPKSVEIVEKTGDSVSILLVYTQEDIADYVVQKANGVEADKRILQARRINPQTVPRILEQRTPSLQPMMEDEEGEQSHSQRAPSRGADGRSTPRAPPAPVTHGDHMNRSVTPIQNGNGHATPLQNGHGHATPLQNGSGHVMPLRVDSVDNTAGWGNEEGEQQRRLKTDESDDDAPPRIERMKSLDGQKEQDEPEIVIDDGWGS